MNTDVLGCQGHMKQLGVVEVCLWPSLQFQAIKGKFSFLFIYFIFFLLFYYLSFLGMMNSHPIVAG